MWFTTTAGRGRRVASQRRSTHYPALLGERPSQLGIIQ